MHGAAVGHLANYLLRIAGRQVRSAGSVMGNLAMCKRFLYPSDAALALMTFGASVGIQSALDAPTVTSSLEDFLQRAPLVGSEVGSRHHQCSAACDDAVGTNCSLLVCLSSCAAAALHVSEQ